MMDYIKCYAYIEGNKISSFAEHVSKEFPESFEDNRDIYDCLPDIIEGTIKENYGSMEFISLDMAIVEEKDNPMEWFGEDERFRPIKAPNLGDMVILFEADCESGEYEDFLSLLKNYVYYGVGEIVNENDDMIGYRYRFKNGKLYEYDTCYIVHPEDPDEIYDDEVIKGVLAYIQDKEGYKKLALKGLLFGGMDF